MQRILLALVLVAVPGVAAAQVRVNPTGVNVNAQGATTVFLTFGGLAGHTLAEGEWCGRLVPAAPAIGLRCDPATVYGRLPARYVQVRPSGSTGLTDIMSIPPSVARRAYQAVERGETAGFYYVRHFLGAPGRPDEYVAVTCRLAGGGARVPLSLVDVRLAWDVETPVLFIEPDRPLPRLSAHLAYTGTGRLIGRWEVVFPGEDPPSPGDLLTEATLPIEERGSQRRYTELSRFNVLLPPTGRFELPGPDPKLLPSRSEGTHLVLLRIETSPDKEGDSSLAAAGAGSGVVTSGAVAGFSLPTLRYVIGRSTSEDAAGRAPGVLALIEPAADVILGPTANVEFSWTPAREAALYRLEIVRADGAILHAALVGPAVTRYRAPSWLRERAADARLRWRVAAISAGGQVLVRSDWRVLGFSK